MAESFYPNPGVTQIQHERLLGRGMASGLIGHPDDPALIYADNTGTREIRVRASRQAILEGYGWQNDAVVVTKTLAANTSGSTRTDLVVLRLDRASFTVSVQIVQGTPGAGAPAATRTSASTGSGVYEMELATVTVANNATTLAASTVTEKAWYLGEDGQVLVKNSNNYPPHAPNRRVWETSTARELLSDGTDWHVARDESGAVTVALAGAFAATRNVVRSRNGWAFVALSVNRPGGNTAANASITVGAIPDGYRPAEAFDGTAVTVGPAGVATVSVSPTGVITLRPLSGLNAGATCVFSPMSWPVA